MVLMDPFVSTITLRRGHGDFAEVVDEVEDNLQVLPSFWIPVLYTVHCSTV